MNLAYYFSIYSNPRVTLQCDKYFTNELNTKIC